MSKAELQALAAEAAADDVVTDEAGAPVADAPAEPEPAEVDSEALLQVVGMAVAAVGGIVCSRAGVTPLSGEEVGGLAGAVVKLAEVYNIRTNPKAAAWIGLVGTSAMIAMPRLAEIEERRRAEAAQAPENEPETAEAAPGGKTQADLLKDAQAPKKPASRGKKNAGAE